MPDEARDVAPRLAALALGEEALGIDRLPRPVRQHREIRCVPAQTPERAEQPAIAERIHRCPLPEAQVMREEIAWRELLGQYPVIDDGVGRVVDLAASPVE